VLLGIYIAGITAGGFANSISFLLATRLVQGVGLAAVPAAFSLLRDTFPPARLATAIGVFGSAYSAGSVVGLLVGASIIQAFGWHATFLSIIPFAILVTLLIARFTRENPGKAMAEKPAEASTEGKGSASIDIKGILALSSTIASFLIALTLIQIGLTSDVLPLIGGAFAASAASLAVFVALERKAIMPFLDLRLLKNRVLLPTYIMVIASGITMFLIYPTIVQLVRSPAPLGFGGSAVDAAHVQLPFMVMFLVFASVTPFIISRVGSVKPTIIGGSVSLLGGLGVLMFHSTEFALSLNLAIVASGLSLSMTAIWNVIVSGSPKEFTGISVGVGALLLFIGMAIGPALAGIYMADHQVIKGVEGSYPSAGSYNWVFLTAALLSSVSLGYALVLQRGMRVQNAAHT